MSYIVPNPDTYAEELLYIPYKVTLARVIDIVCRTAPEGSRVLDLMCGPGVLLDRVAKQRPDLVLHGVDISPEFCQQARQLQPQASIDCADVVNWSCDRRFEAVLCTGSLHHIENLDHRFSVLEKMKRLTVSPGGLIVVCDALLDAFSDYDNRTLANSAAYLGVRYIVETIMAGAPDRVVESVITLAINDMLRQGEYKIPISSFRFMIEEVFGLDVKEERTWPADKVPGHSFGEYVFVVET